MDSRQVSLLEAATLFQGSLPTQESDPQLIYTSFTIEPLQYLLAPFPKVVFKIRVSGMADTFGLQRPKMNGQCACLPCRFVEVQMLLTV